MNENLRSRPQIDFPSFPPQIRNRIMDYVLRPGDIHLPYTRNGIQLLAASKQCYMESHAPFYSDNNFHIPHGQNYSNFLDAYHPKQLHLMRKLTLTCGVLDLDDDMIDHAITAYQTSTGIYASHYLTNKLEQLWINKLCDILRYCPNLKDIRINFPGLSRPVAWEHPLPSENVRWMVNDSVSRISFRDDEISLLRENVEVLCRRKDYGVEVWSPLLDMIRLAPTAVQEIVDEKRRQLRRWEGFRFWLAGEKVEKKKKCCSGI